MSARHKSPSLETLPRMFPLACSVLVVLWAFSNSLVSAIAEDDTLEQDYSNWRRACHVAYALQQEGRGPRRGHVHPDDAKVDLKELRIKLLAAGTDISQVRVKYPSSIEQHIYGQQAENGALRLGYVLKRELEEARAAHGLNPDEQNKILLAGQGDAARFISKVAAFHDRFTRDGILLTEVQSFRRELGQLRDHVMLEDLFDSRSLFGKALKRIVMEPKRIGAARKTDNSISANTHLKSLELELEDVHPLQDDQRENLLKVLTQSFKKSPVIIYGDHYEQRDRLREISDAEYRTALTPEQLEVLRDREPIDSDD